MIYPKLSPSGRALVGGNTLIEHNYKLISPIMGDDKPYGTNPVWTNATNIYYTYSRPGHKWDGRLVQYDFMSLPKFTNGLSGNVLTAGGNRYALWRPDIGVWVSNESVTHPEWHSPALSEDGLLAHGVNNDGTANYAWGSTTVARELQPDVQIILDVTNPSLNWMNFSPEPRCGKPVPIWTGKELFVLFHTNDGCVFLMEFNSKRGYVIKPRNWDGGSGYSHDAKALSVSEIRCVSPGFDVIQSLTEPRVSLPSIVVIPVPPIDPPIDPEPEPPVSTLPDKIIRTLDFFFAAKCKKNEEGEVVPPTGEDNVRQLIIKADEQVAFEHTRQGYGTKRADHGRPVSKDSLAQLTPEGLFIWDLVSGAGGNEPTFVYKKATAQGITGQIYIGPGDPLDGGAVFTPQNHLGGVVIPPVDPPPVNTDCTPVVPTQNIIQDSLFVLRQFCQGYIAPPNALPEYANTKPYVNDEIHDNGLFIGDGLIYFMMSDTGNWAKTLMNPTDKRDWDTKRRAADAALQSYMRKRVGDNS